MLQMYVLFCIQTTIRFDKKTTKIIKMATFIILKMIDLACFEKLVHFRFFLWKEK